MAKRKRERKSRIIVTASPSLYISDEKPSSRLVSSSQIQTSFRLRNERISGPLLAHARSLIIAGNYHTEKQRNGEREREREREMPCSHTGQKRPLSTEPDRARVCVCTRYTRSEEDRQRARERERGEWKHRKVPVSDVL